MTDQAQPYEEWDDDFDFDPDFDLPPGYATPEDWTDAAPWKNPTAKYARPEYLPRAYPHQG